MCSLMYMSKCVRLCNYKSVCVFVCLRVSFVCPCVSMFVRVGSVCLCVSMCVRMFPVCPGVS